ncbi:LamG-like jellyroll fold domain-containing protein [Neorhodopirellula pilleata]|uniref:Uncharacterized protein n=1 Tax=Neorhodopirellula pilleata TaxID=2714738 RepID=A0A5C6AUB0_9BACT|nr:LamG-like jellyroll fold domain-containing protein [Neorhodopirellula pilleata]TWU03603.1 hypothetical protein Pla100_05310 [Neorhodopirellula pilleata]
MRALLKKLRKRIERRNRIAHACRTPSRRQSLSPLAFRVLEPRRVLNASFELAGVADLLLADFDNANLEIAETADGNEYRFTLDSGIWSGTDGVSVSGSGTNLLSVLSPSLQSISIDDADSGADLVVDIMDLDFHGDVVVSGGVLQGTNGTITGTVTIQSGSHFSPGDGPGVVTTGNLVLNSGSTFTVEVDDNNNAVLTDASRGGVAGTDYDQVQVNGTVVIASDVTLDLQDIGSTENNPRDVYTIIDNDGSTDLVTGRFHGLEDGAVVAAAGGIQYQIHYNGGDGNDVVLIGLAAAQPDVYVSNSFTQTPGSLIADVDFTTPGNQAGIAGVDGFLTIAEGIESVDSGGTVHVDSGTFVHSGTLLIDRSVTIDGQGLDQTQIRSAGAPGNRFAEAIRITAADVTISDAQLGWENFTSNDYSGYVVITTTANTTINRVQFGETFGHDPSLDEGYRSAIVFEQNADGLEVSDSIFEGRWGRAAIRDGEHGSGENFLITRNEFREDHFRWGPIAIGPQGDSGAPNNFAFSGEISFNYFANGLDPIDFQSGGDQNYTITITNAGLTLDGLVIDHNTFDWDDTNVQNQNGVFAQPAAIYITPSYTANTDQILIQDNIFNGYSYGGPQPGATDPAWIPTGGVFDGALDFDGVDDFGVLQDPLIDIGSAGTIAFWINPEDVGGQRHSLFNGGGVEVTLRNGAIYFYPDSSEGSSLTYSSTGSFTADTWTHVAVSWDFATQSTAIYLNGVEASYLGAFTPANSSWSTAANTADQLIRVGSDPANPDRIYPGKMDDIGIFNEALTASEIMSIKESGVSAYTGANLLAHWDFDQISGNVAVDNQNGIPLHLTTEGIVPFGPEYQASQGVFGGALSFDGADDFATFQDPTFDVGEGGTLNFWVQMDNTGTRNQFFEGPENSGFEMQYRTNGGGQLYGRTTGNGDFVIRSGGDGTTLNSGWHNIQYTWDFSSSEMRVYLNGIESTYLNNFSPGDLNWTSITDTVNGLMNVGRDPGSGRFFDGLMDDIAWYDSALSTTELLDIRNNGVSAHTDLVAHWGFDLAPTIENTYLGDSGTSIELFLQQLPPLPPVTGYSVVTPSNAAVLNNAFFNGAAGTYADSNQTLDPSNITGSTANPFFAGDDPNIPFVGDSLEEFYQLRFGSSAGYQSTEYQGDITTSIPHIGANQEELNSFGTEDVLVTGTDEDDLLMVTFTSDNDGYFTLTRNVTGVAPDFVGTFHFTDVDSFTFEGYGGDDVFIIVQPTETQGGHFSLINGITFNGGIQNGNGNALESDGINGGDTLVLLKSEADQPVVDSVVYALGVADPIKGHNGTITLVDGLLSTVITFSGVEPIRDELSVDQRSFLYSSTENGGDETIEVTAPGDFVGMISTDFMGNEIKPDVAFGAVDNLIQSSLGPDISFANSNTRLAINAGVGDDVVNINSIDAEFRSAIFIDGDTGNDSVNLNTDLTLGDHVLGNSGDLLVTAESIVVEGIAIDTTAATTSGQTGNVTFNAGRTIILNPGSSITTQDGEIQFDAGNSPLANDNFGAIRFFNAMLSTTGSGDISVVGIGTSDATTSGNFGVLVNRSTVQASGSGNVSIAGTGGEGDNFNRGIFVVGESARITAGTGGLNLVGTGGSNGQDASSINSSDNNQGVLLSDGAEVFASGAVVITGTGGDGGSGNSGVVVASTALGDTAVRSHGGGITIAGVGRGSGDSNTGVLLTGAAGGMISDTGDGTIVIVGQGEGSGMSVDGVLVSRNSRIETSGSLFVTVTDSDIRQLGVPGDAKFIANELTIRANGADADFGVVPFEIDANVLALEVGGVARFENTSGLVIGDTSSRGGGVGLSASSVTNEVLGIVNGSLTISHNVTTSDSIVLRANEAAAADDNLTVDAAVTVRATAGDITLEAGDSLRLQSGSIIEAVAGNLILDSGFNDDDDIGEMTLDGAITANTTFGIIRLDLNGEGAATQAATGNIVGNSLELISEAAAGSFMLDQSVSNDVDVIAAFTDGAIAYRDADTLTVGTVNASNGIITTDDDVTLCVLNDDLDLRASISAGAASVRLQAESTDGEIFQKETSGAIHANALGVRSGSGGIALSSTTNDINIFAAHSIGAIHFINDGGFTVDAITAGSCFAETTGVTATTGDVNLHAFSGNVTTNEIIRTTSGDIVVDVDSGTLETNGVVSSTSGNIDLTADVVHQNADIVTGDSDGAGTIVITADNGSISMADGTTTGSGSGLITLVATDSIAVSIVSSTSGDARLTADSNGNDSGSITDNLTMFVAGEEVANITVDELALRAGSGIGSVDDIDLNVNTLATVTKSGSIRLHDVDGSGVTVGTFDLLSGIAITDANDDVTGGDHITLRSAGALVVNEDVINLDAGNVLLSAENVGSDITANADVRSAGGHVTLMSADAIELTATVSVDTTGTGTIHVDAGTGAFTMAADAVLRATDGDIHADAGGNVTLGRITTNANVALTSDLASILDADTAGDSAPDIIANSLRLNAAIGAGEAGNHLETTINSVSGRTSIGGLFLRETDAITVTDVAATTQKVNSDSSLTTIDDAAQSDLVATNGSIVLTTASGNITLNDGATGVGSTDGNSVVATGAANIRIAADEATTDIITNADINGGTGSVHLSAGNDITINDDLFTTETGSVLVEAVHGSVLLNDTTDANETGISTDNGDILIVAANDVTLNADLTSTSGDIGIDSGIDISQTSATITADITTGGSVSMKAGDNITMAAGTSIDAGTDVIATAASGKLRLGLIDATNVSLVASSDSVLDNNDAGGPTTNVRATNLIIFAGDSIGDNAGNLGLATNANAIDTEVTNLAASSASGIYLQELADGDSITVDSVASVTVEIDANRIFNDATSANVNFDHSVNELEDLHTTSVNGPIKLVTENGRITINGGADIAGVRANGTGDVLLEARGTSSDVIVNASITSGTGHITLDADRSVEVSERVTTSGSGTIYMLAGTDIDLDSSVTSLNGDILIEAGDDIRQTALISSTAGDIGLIAAQNVTQSNSGDITTTTGDVLVQASAGNWTMNGDTTITSGGQDVLGLAGNSMTLGVISVTNATANRIALQAGGSITDANAGSINIQETIGAASTSLSLRAGTIIGGASGTTSSTNNFAIDLNVDTVAALSASGIYLRELAAGGSIMVDAASAVSIDIEGVRRSDFDSGTTDVSEARSLAVLEDLTTSVNGPIKLVTENGRITINGGADTAGVRANGTGDVLLEARGTSSDVIVNASITSGTGHITLDADRSVEVSERVTTSGSGTIYMVAGTDIDLDSSVTSLNGDILIEAGEDIRQTALISSTAGEVGLIAAQNVTQSNSGDITTTTGDVLVQASAGNWTMNGDTTITSGGQDVLGLAGNSITLGVISVTNATANRIALQAGGSITDANAGSINIQETIGAASTSLSLRAGTIIGGASGTTSSTNNLAMDLNVDTVAALSASGIYLRELAAGGSIMVDTASAVSIDIEGVRRSDFDSGTTDVSEARSLAVLEDLTTSVNGPIKLVTENGRITINGGTDGIGVNVVGAGDLLFEARGFSSDVITNANVQTGSGHVTLFANDDIFQNADVSTSGDGTIFISAFNQTVEGVGNDGVIMSPVADTDTDGGNVFIRATNESDILLGWINAGSADVRLDAQRDILDNNASITNVTSRNLVAVADSDGDSVGQIGNVTSGNNVSVADARSIDADVDSVAASSATGIFVWEMNSLTVSRIDFAGVARANFDSAPSVGVAGSTLAGLVTTNAGDILVDSQGSLSISQAIHAGVADVRLIADGNVTQSSEGVITANEFGVRQETASGDIQLGFANNVDKLTAFTADPGGAISFRTTRDLMIVEVPSQSNSETTFDTTNGLTANTLNLVVDGTVTNAADIRISIADQAIINSESHAISLGNQVGDRVDFGRLDVSGSDVIIVEDSSTQLTHVQAASLHLTSGGSISDVNPLGATIEVRGQTEMIGTNISLADQANDVLRMLGDVRMIATTDDVSIARPGFVELGVVVEVTGVNVSINENTAMLLHTVIADETLNLFSETSVENLVPASVSSASGLIAQSANLTSDGFIHLAETRFDRLSGGVKANASIEADSRLTLNRTADETGTQVLGALNQNIEPSVNVSPNFISGETLGQITDDFSFIEFQGGRYGLYLTNQTSLDVDEYVGAGDAVNLYIETADGHNLTISNRVSIQNHTPEHGSMTLIAGDELVLVGSFETYDASLSPADAQRVLQTSLIIDAFDANEGPAGFESTESVLLSIATSVDTKDLAINSGAQNVLQRVSTQIGIADEAGFLTIVRYADGLSQLFETFSEADASTLNGVGVKGPNAVFEGAIPAHAVGSSDAVVFERAIPFTSTFLNTFVELPTTLVARRSTDFFLFEAGGRADLNSVSVDLNSATDEIFGVLSNAVPPTFSMPTEIVIGDAFFVQTRSVSDISMNPTTLLSTDDEIPVSFEKSKEVAVFAVGFDDKNENGQPEDSEIPTRRLILETEPLADSTDKGLELRNVPELRAGQRVLSSRDVLGTETPSPSDVEALMREYRSDPMRSAGVYVIVESDPQTGESILRVFTVRDFESRDVGDVSFAQPNPSSNVDSETEERNLPPGGEGAGDSDTKEEAKSDDDSAVVESGVGTVLLATSVRRRKRIHQQTSQRGSSHAAEETQAGRNFDRRQRRWRRLDARHQNNTTRHEGDVQ